MVCGSVKEEKKKEKWRALNLALFTQSYASKARRTSASSPAGATVGTSQSGPACERKG